MRILITCLFTTLMLAGLQAQPPGERLQTYKISFLTKSLELTPEEAQQFWPIYNEYQEKVKELRTERRDKFYEKWHNENAMTASEYDQSLEDYSDMRQREVDLEKEYIEKFQQVLPNWKVAHLIVAEERFKQIVLEELRNRMKRQGPPRR